MIGIALVDEKLVVFPQIVTTCYDKPANSAANGEYNLGSRLHKRADRIAIVYQPPNKTGVCKLG